MEFIFVSTVVSRAALYAVERFYGDSKEMKKAEKTEDEKDDISGGSRRDGESRSVTNATENGPSSGTGNELSNGVETGPLDVSTVDQDNVESVERAIARLRGEASQLTSADTFVQYARVTRQATKLEKRLKELKKDEDDVIAGGLDFERIAGAMSQVMTDRAARSATRQFTSGKQMIGIGIRVLLMVTLWYRFSSTSLNPTKRDIVAVPCAALRPLAFLFRRQSSGCVADDWVCETTDAQMCSVSYMVAAGLCNGAVGAFLSAIERLW